MILIRKLLTIALCVALLARACARFLPLPPAWIDLAVLIVGGARLLIPFAQIARRELPWSRGIFPALLAFSLVSMFGGSQSRLVARAAAVAAEPAIVAAVLYAVKKPGGGASLEERIRQKMELFFPPLPARLITGELVIVRAAALGLTGRARHAPGAASVEFGYVENSFMPLLPWLMLLSCPADILLLHVLLRFPHAALTYVLAFLNLYGVVWIYGIAVTMRQRPISSQTDD